MLQHDSRNDEGSAAGEFLELVCKAFMGGVASALVLALAALALSLSANAVAAAKPVTLNDPRTGTLLLRTSTPGEFVEAPRLETEVAIQVTGLVARTRVAQTFHNPGEDFVEGVYVFPLPEKAAVDHLWMQVGERLIEGRIHEKEEARRAYDKAKREGRKAALVEQQRPNLFTNSVAHIGPGEKVRVTIEYQQSLAYENGEYRLRFPLAVTPRYMPPEALAGPLPDEPKTVEAGGGIVHPDYESSDCGGGLVNPVDIAVVIDAGVPLAKVESSYHEAWIEKQAGGRTVVYLVKEQEEADRDFELVWSIAPGAEPKAAVFTERVGASDYALVMVMPPQPDARERAALARFARETILVVDTSGSMQGTSMEQAKSALAHALETLAPGDRFNVIEFNSHARALFPQALAAGAANLEHAKGWVKALAAQGGTNMAPALKIALDGADTPGYLRQVIFITDGAVGNEDELFKLISERLGASRLFTVGIGSAPNSHFMTKAAQFGRGTFTYIGDVREVREKMATLFAKIEAPVLKDVAIRWADGRPVETFPPRVPDLYLGEPIVVSAAVPGSVGTVIVSGSRGDQPWSVALTPAAGEAANGVGALWARAKISSLMDRQRTGADPAMVRDEVVKVAIEHHLVSAYTSLVAVDVTPTAPADGVRTALVKASLPHGQTAGEIPQTDTPALLQFILGLLALGGAGAVATIGRRASRRFA